jgi:recombination protein RecT
MTALRSTPHLAECTPDTFMGCVLQTAQLGLEVNTPLGHAYLIPRRNNKRGGIYECTLIIGYQGQIELAMRSGRIDQIFAHVVREGDDFDYELGLEPKLRHRPSEDPDREQRPITHAYAVARVKDASPTFRVLTAAQIQARMARSSAASSGRTSPWETDPEAMCCKSAVRALWPWLPKSPEMARAESVEVTQETGRSPTIAFSPEVQAAILATGVQTPEPEPEPELEPRDEAPETDPETGETIPPGVGAGRSDGQG